MILSMEIMDTTFDILHQQLKYRYISTRKGTGTVYQLYTDGPFIVYSRISVNDLLHIIRLRLPPNRMIESLDEMKTIFLAGPTPEFFGAKKASTSWRRSFVDYLTKTKQLDDSYLVVLPEPYGCDWKDVDYDCLTEPMEHVYAQIHWETHFIDLAVKTGVYVAHAYARWSGNALPTGRFEIGKLLSLMEENKLKAAVINCPKESQSIQYITAHILDAELLYYNDKFILTQCSSLNLNSDNVPIDKDGNVIEAGIYPNGGIELGNLDPFFHAICDVACKL